MDNGADDSVPAEGADADGANGAGAVGAAAGGADAGGADAGGAAADAADADEADEADAGGAAADAADADEADEADAGGAAADAADAAFDAIVLAGGTARRLQGADKPAQQVAGRSLLDRALVAVADAGTIVVVGPRRPVAASVAWCREEPAGGGPVAALAAGLGGVSAEVVVVLAADLPWVAPAVPLLRAAVRGEIQAALLSDAEERDNYLAAAWLTASLRQAIAAVGDPVGASMRRLYAGVRIVRVIDTAGWGLDCDTWDDLAVARRDAPQRDRRRDLAE